MLRKIIKFLVLVLVFMCTLSLSGCGIIKSLLNLKAEYEDTTIMVEYEKVFFTNDFGAVITPVVQVQSEPNRGLSPIDYTNYETTVSNGGLVDTSKVGKQTFTVASSIIYNSESLDFTTEIDVYVIDFNIDNGIYYNTGNFDTINPFFKVDNNIISLYDINTNSFTQCSIMKNANVSEIYDENTRTLQNENSFYFETYTSNGTAENRIYFSIEDNKIKISSYGFCNEEDLVYVSPLNNTWCGNFCILKENNHLSLDQINNINNFGILTLDEEKVQIVDENTEIIENQIYIYCEQKDYTEESFIGSYYDSSLRFVIEGNKLNNVDGTPEYLNYTATHEGNIWYIKSVYYDLEFNETTKVLTEKFDEDTVYTYKLK